MWLDVLLLIVSVAVIDLFFAIEIWYPGSGKGLIGVRWNGAV